MANSPADDSVRVNEQQAIVRFPYAVKLLERAAQRLHDNHEPIFEEPDDPLAVEIDQELEAIQKERQP